MSFLEKFFILLFVLGSMFFFIFLYTADLYLSVKIIIPLGIIGLIVISILSVLENRKISLRKG